MEEEKIEREFNLIQKDLQLDLDPRYSIKYAVIKMIK